MEGMRSSELFLTRRKMPKAFVQRVCRCLSAASFFGPRDPLILPKSIQDLQDSSHLSCRGPGFRVLVEQPEDAVLGLAGYGPPVAARKRHGGVPDEAQSLAPRLAVEGRPAVEKDKDADADAPDVGGLVVAAADDLWGDVAVLGWREGKRMGCKRERLKRVSETVGQKMIETGSLLQSQSRVCLCVGSL